MTINNVYVGILHNWLLILSNFYSFVQVFDYQDVYIDKVFNDGKYDRYNLFKLKQRFVLKEVITLDAFILFRIHISLDY